jgi:hypothetical protein
MKKLLPILLLIIMSSVFGQDCSDLFFSEYLEGSGNNKALEIYNPTDGIIDLSKYWVARYSNGLQVYTQGGITQLQGFILPKSTFILVNGQLEDADLGGGSTSPRCDPALQELATETYNGMLDSDYPSPTYMNGNDAIALFKDPVGNGNYNDFIAIDLFGAIADGMQSTDEGWASFTQEWIYRNIYEDSLLVGRDSAFIRKYIVPEGYYWIPWTSGHSLIRKSTVKNGVTALVDSFNVTLEWDTVPGGEDVWDYLGSHTCDCNQTAIKENSADNNDLFIYPNPVENNRLIFYTAEYLEQIVIYDITGKLVLSAKMNGETGMVSLSLDILFPGIYLLKAGTTNNTILNRKFILR